ncbi:MAG: hypothetical protein U0670_11435 [Anaerolineae bacterium]
MLRLLIRPSLLALGLAAVLIGVVYVAGAAFAAPGQILAFTATVDTGRAYVGLFDLARGDVRAFNDATLQQSFADWSADGMRLAVAQLGFPQVEAAPLRTTRIIDFGTGQEHIIGGTGYAERFSPDGRWLASARQIEGVRAELRLIDAESGQASRLSRQINVSGSPAWMPDGSAVLIGGNRGNESDQIYRFGVDASEPERLTESQGNNFNPQPSPDGRWLLFLSYQQRGLRAVLVPLATPGDEPRAITAGDGFCQYPEWSPDSTRIAVICQGMYGQLRQSLFVAYVDQGEIDFLVTNVMAVPMAWVTEPGSDTGAILYAGADGFLYRVAAPIAPIEGTGQPRPIPVPIRRLYTDQAYLPLGVRP